MNVTSRVARRSWARRSVDITRRRPRSAAPKGVRRGNVIASHAHSSLNRDVGSLAAKRSTIVTNAKCGACAHGNRGESPRRPGPPPAAWRTSGYPLRTALGGPGTSLDELRMSLDEPGMSLGEQKRSLDELRMSLDQPKRSFSEPRRSFSGPLIPLERSRIRWNGSGRCSDECGASRARPRTGRNGRERLESGIWTAETLRGGGKRGLGAAW